MWAFIFFIFPKNGCFKFSSVNPFRKFSWKWGSFSIFRNFSRKCQKIICGTSIGSLCYRTSPNIILVPSLGMWTFSNNFWHFLLSHFSQFDHFSLIYWRKCSSVSWKSDTCDKKLLDFVWGYPGSIWGDPSRSLGSNTHLYTIFSHILTFLTFFRNFEKNFPPIFSPFKIPAV